MIVKRAKIAWGLRVIIAAALISAPSCRGKGSTKLTYAPPAAPLQFSLAIDKNGVCTVRGGVVTPVGMFGIEHSFPTREEFTYIIIRNRSRGTDHVFKISKSGHVDIHAVGDHTLRLHRDDNKFYVDVTSVYGTLEFKAYPSNSAIARVDFGKDSPDAVVTTDRKLIIEYASIWKSNKHISVDTLKAVEFGRRWPFGSRWVKLEYKDGLAEEPTVVDIETSDDTNSNCDALANAVQSIEPTVHCKHQVYWLRGAAFLAAILLALLLPPLAILGLIYLVSRSLRKPELPANANSRKNRESQPGYRQAVVPRRRPSDPSL